MVSNSLCTWSKVTAPLKAFKSTSLYFLFPVSIPSPRMLSLGLVRTWMLSRISSVCLVVVYSDILINAPFVNKLLLDYHALHELYFLLENTHTHTYGTNHSFIYWFMYLVKKCFLSIFYVFDARTLEKRIISAFEEPTV